MTTVNGDHGHAGWRKFDIDCQDALPVSIAFTDNPRMIVSGERYSNAPGGRLLRYHIAPDPSDQRNAPQNLDAIGLNGIDRAVVSRDGKWILIITGTIVMVRNMTTDEVVEVDEHMSGVPVHAIDVSRDSTKFATGSEDKIVRVFSINTKKVLLTLSEHNNSLLGVKFSPDGAYLASAAFGDPIRVWDALNGDMIFQTSKDVVYGPAVNTQTAAQDPICIPIGWSSDSKRVFTVSSGKVMMLFQPPPPMWYHDSRGTGPTVVRFGDSVPASDDSTLVSLATNGRIIACAAGRSLSFWDSFSSSKIGPSTITFQDPILSLALSSDNSYLACGRSDKKITVYLLRDILPLHVIVDPNFHLPYINVDHTTFKLWIEQDLGKAKEILERETQSGSCVANLALVRAQCQDWYTALKNAEKSLAARPSIIGHIALARALVGQGQQESGFEAFDAVFRTCGTDENRFLLLIKAILLFLSGKRENAVTRVKDLIPVSDDSEKYNCLHVLGIMYLLQGDWKEAFESFERARSLAFYRRGHHLMTILLIFGPSFEEREITLRHPLREAIIA